MATAHKGLLFSTPWVPFIYMTVSTMISTYFEYVSQYAKTTKHIIHVIAVVTGNISLNLNGDRQQGYKFEQIDDGDSFNLTVWDFVQ